MPLAKSNIVHMDLDTYSYFLIVLSGFGLVWGFRKGIRSKGSITDFEYLGFSAFWGVLVLAGFQWLYRNDAEKFTGSLKNPYAAGVGLCMVSLVLGYGVGLLLWEIRNRIKR